jgi:MoaA/NifB/PqqE/SkfB family radical SAM enzyme
MMCDIKNHSFGKKHEITQSEIEGIIDEMVEMDIPELVLTGGEPFLYEKIFEIITYAKKMKRKVVMITNGFYGGDITEKIIASQADHLQISLDGSNAKVYEEIRGVRGSFDIVINNIKRFVSCGKSVAVTATITKQNYADLLNIAYLARSLGCNRLALRPAHVSNADPLNKDSLNCNFWIPQEELGAFRKVCADLEEFNMQGNFLDFNPGIELLPEYFKNGYLHPKGSCFIGFTRLIISYDEKNSYGVWMCRDMVGDIRKESLKKIWHGKKARKMRQLIKKCNQGCFFPEIHEPELSNFFTLFKRTFKSFCSSQV